MRMCLHGACVKCRTDTGSKVRTVKPGMRRVRSSRSVKRCSRRERFSAALIITNAARALFAKSLACKALCQGAVADKPRHLLTVGK